MERSFWETRRRTGMTTARVVGACAVVLVAVLVALLARQRMNAAGVGTGGVVSAVSAESSTGAAGRGESAQAAGQALASVSSGRLDDVARTGVITHPQASALNEALLDRVKFTLDPKFDEWQERARRWGVSLSTNPFNDDKPFTKEEFDKAGRMLAEGVYAWGEAAVRTLFHDGKRVEKDFEVGVMARAGVRAKYPRPADPERERATIIEVVVPAELTNPSGTRMKVRVGFAFWWQTSAPGGGRWVPWDVSIYFPPGPVSVYHHIL